MRIIKSCEHLDTGSPLTGFPNRSAEEFFEDLAPYKNKIVWFRIRGERSEFRKGYLRDYGGDTVTFWNGISDGMSWRDWVFAYNEVEVAIDVSN